MKIATPKVMERIRDCINDADTPSWLRSVPHNFGDAAAGSLKADEWRTFFTVYLPLAIISLWAESVSGGDAEFEKVLDHTMLLVSAVSIACMRTMTQEKAAAYLECMVCYIRDLKVLHPHATHRTNHHMAIHVYDFLLLFGPVYSWWCFPFERLIGQLQRLSSNHKFGMFQSSTPLIIANIFFRGVGGDSTSIIYTGWKATTLAFAT
jgi:hypothetical protein